MDWIPKNLNITPIDWKCVPKIPTENHPLTIRLTSIDVKGKTAGKRITASRKDEANKPISKASWDGLDPLSAALNMAKLDNDDEDDFSKLGEISSSSSSTHHGSSRGSIVITDESLRLWTPLRAEILTGFTTNDKLSLKSSFLPHSSKTVTAGASVPSVVSLTEKVKNRLEQLDEMDESAVCEERNLSTKEYISRIEELQQIVISSWSTEQRVKALKIAIQCSKLLTDLSSITFYPSKSVLVADVLDKFGSLVFDRINDKVRLSSDDVALETCRNWFYKIASIREMIPRFYVEAAIMRIYSFIEIEGEPTQKDTLNRLSSMIRGVSDPIVATYCRMFLCRVALKVSPQNKSFFAHQLREVFVIMNTQASSITVKNLLEEQKLSLLDYCKILSPAVIWMSKCLALDATEDAYNDNFSTISRLISRNDIPELNLVVLTAVVSSFKSSFIVKNFDVIFELLDNYATIPGGEVSTTPLLVSLGKAFNAESCSSLTRDEKVNVLRIVWSKVSSLRLPFYLSCAEVWIDFVATHLTTKEVNSFLKDVLKHLEGREPTSEEDCKIAKILSTVFSWNREHSIELMTMDSLIPLMESIHEDTIRLGVAKEVVTNFLKTHTSPDTDVDSIEFLNNLGFLCQIVHDSVTAVTLEDEKRDISALISGYLRLVVFSPGIDIETRFNLLQEGRASFFHIDSVLSFLVYAVNGLPFMTGSNKSRIPLDFVKTCLAYSFTTIPSIIDPTIKLQLYMHSSQVALVHACLSQLDSFVKAAINLLSQLPKSHTSLDGHSTSYDSFFLNYCRELCSILLFIPDHPDHEPLYLLKGLLTVIETHDFEGQDTAFYLFLELLTLLSWSVQETYPIHLRGVDSNDILYAGDQEFSSDVSILTGRVLRAALDHISVSSDPKRQAILCLELFQRMIIYADIEKMGKLVVKLWQVMLRYGEKDAKFKERMKNSLSGVPGETRTAIENIQMKRQA